MRLVARISFVAASLSVAACSPDESVDLAPLDAGRVGASIAVLASTGEVAVVNPDQGSVSFVDATTLEQKATIVIGDEPRALVETSSGDLFVTARRSGAIARIDPRSREVRAERAICRGPYGLATSPDESSIFVACEWEGAVVRVDPKTLDATKIASGLKRPRAIVAVGADVYVTEFTGGDVVRIASDGSTTRTPLTPAESSERPALTSMTANLASAVVPAFGRLAVAHELVNHTGDTSAEKVEADYGSVTDGNPKINPAVSAVLPGGLALTSRDPAVLYATFDGTNRSFNAPSALATFGEAEILVANESSNDVAVLDANAMSSNARVLASYTVGAGPLGIAVDEAHHVAFVDNAYDGSISRIDLSMATSTDAPRYAASLTRVRDLPKRFSDAALEGRRLFHDATNTHVTPSGVVACSTCHPGGSDDGLVWFIHTSDIPLKRRRTPDLADAHTKTAPFHWNGQFATMHDLVGATVTQLMAGDGLLVDVDSVQKYIDEIVLPPIPPEGDADAVERGRAIFESKSAACASCHSGADFTDDAFHAVLSPMSLSADDVFTRANTPALHGVFDRAPYFHDGRATDLRDLLTRADARGHGGVKDLTPSQIDDLIAYLQSL